MRTSSPIADAKERWQDLSLTDCQFYSCSSSLLTSSGLCDILKLRIYSAISELQVWKRGQARHCDFLWALWKLCCNAAAVWVLWLAECSESSHFCKRSQQSVTATMSTTSSILGKALGCTAAVASSPPLQPIELCWCFWSCRQVSSYENLARYSTVSCPTNLNQNSVAVFCILE